MHLTLKLATHWAFSRAFFRRWFQLLKKADSDVKKARSFFSSFLSRWNSPAAFYRHQLFLTSLQAFSRRSKPPRKKAREKAQCVMDIARGGKSRDNIPEFQSLAEKSSRMPLMTSTPVRYLYARNSATTPVKYPDHLPKNHGIIKPLKYMENKGHK